MYGASLERIRLGARMKPNIGSCIEAKSVKESLEPKERVRAVGLETACRTSYMHNR